MILVCYRWPRAGRFTWVVIFGAAGAFNLYTALTGASAYLMYSETAVLPFYRAFINGIFSRNTALFVGLIASGQIVVALLLLLGKPVHRIGMMGGMLFLFAICPLGVGSAFPAPLLMGASFVVLWRRWKAPSVG